MSKRVASRDSERVTISFGFPSDWLLLLFQLFRAAGPRVCRSRVYLTCYVNSRFVNGDVVLCPRDMLSDYEFPNKRRERQSEALVTAKHTSHEDP